MKKEMFKKEAKKLLPASLHGIVYMQLFRSELDIDSPLL